MSNILDAVVKLLDPTNDFNKVLAFLGIYLVLLWAAFCLWVFVDARKRYNNIFIAFLFFILVLILNFPVLIFYFVIRPENPEDNILYLQSDQGISEGVNVPIINFVGEKGVEMTFSLRINKHASHASDMKVNVDFVSENKDFKVEKKKDVKEAKEVASKPTEKKPGIGFKLKNAVSNSTIKLSGQASKLKGVFKLRKKKEETLKEKESEKKEETKAEEAKSEEVKSEEVKAEVKSDSKKEVEETASETKAEEKSEEKSEEAKDLKQES